MASKLTVAVNESTSSQVQCCWICFATSTENSSAEWVKPCKCIDTVQWVHQQCLQRWVDVKQKGNSLRPVKCPHCLTEYLIVLPQMGFFVTVLHEVNEMCKTFCPFLVAGVGVIILYWTSVTYGAITVIQVMGYDDGMQFLERTQPLFLVIALPSIPIALIVSQFFRWDDILSNTLLKFIDKGPNGTTAPDIESSSSFTLRNHTPMSGSRMLCSALLLPTVSTIVGKAFQRIHSNLLKAILGGISFIAVKGVINIILQHSELLSWPLFFWPLRMRKILDYNDSNLQGFVNNRQVNRSYSDTGESSSSEFHSNTSMEMLVLDNLMP